MNIEKLLKLMGEMQEMVAPNDKLTYTLNKIKKNVDDELQEDDLEMFWAARGDLQFPGDKKRITAVVTDYRSMSFS